MTNAIASESMVIEIRPPLPWRLWRPFFRAILLFLSALSIPYRLALGGRLEEREFCLRRTMGLREYPDAHHARWS